MIEGLTALPWVHEKRDQPHQETALQCDYCMDNLPTAVRASMNCGHLPASEHGGTPERFAAGLELTVCAGYTTGLPDVEDIARQFSHWENGAMDHVCPRGVPKPLLDGLVILKSASEARAAYRMREALEKQKAGNRGG